MKGEPMELVRGSGNVFRDFGHPDADVLQMKAIWPRRSSRCWIARN